MAKVIISEYNYSWPSLYQEESAALQAAFGDNLAGVFHIGSTAVPGMPSRPTIDILLSVNDMTAASKTAESLCENGYILDSKMAEEGKTVLHKETEAGRTHTVYIVDAKDEDKIEGSVGFVRMLGGDADMAMQYADVKKKLAAMYQNDEASYNEGKTKWLDGEDPFDSGAAFVEEEYEEEEEEEETNAPVAESAEEEAEEEKAEDSAAFIPVVTPAPSFGGAHEEKSEPAAEAEKSDTEAENLGAAETASSSAPQVLAYPGPKPAVLSYPGATEAAPAADKNDKKPKPEKAPKPIKVKPEKAPEQPKAAAPAKPEREKKEKTPKVKAEKHSKKEAAPAVEETTDNKKRSKKRGNEKRQGYISIGACLLGTLGFYLGAFVFSNGILGLLIGLVAGGLLGFAASLLFKEV